MQFANPPSYNVYPDTAKTTLDVVEQFAFTVAAAVMGSGRANVWSKPPPDAARYPEYFVVAPSSKFPWHAVTPAFVIVMSVMYQPGCGLVQLPPYSGYGGAPPP